MTCKNNALNRLGVILLNFILIEIEMRKCIGFSHKKMITFVCSGLPPKNYFDIKKSLRQN